MDDGMAPSHSRVKRAGLCNVADLDYLYAIEVTQVRKGCFYLVSLSKIAYRAPDGEPGCEESFGGVSRQVSVKTGDKNSASVIHCKIKMWQLLFGRGTFMFL
jgi:hypothetical protein